MLKKKKRNERKEDEEYYNNQVCIHYPELINVRILRVTYLS
jgi:hypothetical protein